MMRDIRSRLFFPACMLVLVVLTAACGRKTYPLVPASPRPEVVKNVKIVSRDAVAFLTWPVPAKNVEGRAMRPEDIALLQVERSETGWDGKMGLYRRVAEISVTNPAPARVDQGAVFWSDRGLKYGQTYGYRVRAISVRGGTGGWSDEARVTPVVSPAVPRNISATGGDSSCLITWDTVTTLVDGKPATGYVGYNLYRGTEEGRRDESPLNSQPVTKTSYRDTAVSNDRAYYYSVRSVGSPTQPWHESLDSVTVSAIPRKLTPPAAPTGLTAVQVANKVFLTWNENRERDLAGYHVYRSIRAGKDYERLTAKVLTKTSFSDDSVRDGVTYHYVITAVDQSGNESKRSEEQKIFVESLFMEGASSNESQTAPPDLAPPARPRGLTAVPGVNRVLLTWHENRRHNLAGYLVYRSETSGRDYQRLTEKPVTAASYQDETVKGGVTYFYVIVAVSKTGKESARSEEKKVYVEKMP